MLKMLCVSDEGCIHKAEMNQGKSWKKKDLF